MNTCDVKLGNTVADFNHEYSLIPKSSNKNLMQKSKISAALSCAKSPCEYSVFDPVDTEFSEALNLMTQSKKTIVLKMNTHDPRCKIRRAKSNSKSHCSNIKISLLTQSKQEVSPVKKRKLKVRNKNKSKVASIFSNSLVKAYS